MFLLTIKLFIYLTLFSLIKAKHWLTSAQMNASDALEKILETSLAAYDNHCIKTTNNNTYRLKDSNVEGELLKIT